jgi:hypothetical protein
MHPTQSCLCKATQAKFKSKNTAASSPAREFSGHCRQEFKTRLYNFHHQWQEALWQNRGRLGSSPHSKPLLI